MREIKFRAWDGKQMHYKDFMAISLEGKRYTYSDETWWTDYSNDPWGELGDVELMQFTGLYDKNGKEIWEGDILKSKIMKTLMPVKWYSESAGFHLAWIVGHNVEVIGNIYEHPDLLKGVGNYAEES